MTEQRKVSRRRALQLTATGAALPLVHIRTAGAAGKLTFAMWDHWVPTGNDAVRKVVNDWAQKNKVEVNIDFLSSNGEKIDITMAAEAQARADTTSTPSISGPCTSGRRSSTRWTTWCNR